MSSESSDSVVETNNYKKDSKDSKDYITLKE